PAAGTMPMASRRPVVRPRSTRTCSAALNDSRRDSANAEIAAKASGSNRTRKRRRGLAGAELPPDGAYRFRVELLPDRRVGCAKAIEKRGLPCIWCQHDGIAISAHGSFWFRGVAALFNFRLPFGEEFLGDFSLSSTSTPVNADPEVRPTDTPV